MKIDEIEITLTAFGTAEDGTRWDIATWGSGKIEGPVVHNARTEIVDGQQRTFVTISWTEKGDDDAE